MHRPLLELLGKHAAPSSAAIMLLSMSARMPASCLPADLRMHTNHAYEQRGSVLLPDQAPHEVADFKLRAQRMPPTRLRKQEGCQRHACTESGRGRACSEAAIAGGDCARACQAATRGTHRVRPRLPTSQRARLSHSVLPVHAQAATRMCGTLASLLPEQAFLFKAKASTIRLRKQNTKHTPRVVVMPPALPVPPPAQPPSGAARPAHSMVVSRVPSHQNYFSMKPCRTLRSQPLSSGTR
jgi:hypothetical protein